MDGIEFKGSGDFKHTDNFLRKLLHIDLEHKAKRYGERGVHELASNTPIKTGNTANSWGYTVEKTEVGITVYFTNSYAPNGIPVPFLLENGHAARDGSWVSAQPFVERTVEPIYKDMADDIWKGVID